MASLLDKILYRDLGHKIIFEKIQFGPSGDWEENFPDSDWPKLEITVDAKNREEEEMWWYCMSHLAPKLTKEKFREVLEKKV